MRSGGGMDKEIRIERVLRPGELPRRPGQHEALTAFGVRPSGTLLSEIHVTRMNAKAEPDDLLEAEFLRCFCTEPDEAVQWAFREWRENSPFFPSISDVIELIDFWHAARRRDREQVETEERRQEMELARLSGGAH